MEELFVYAILCGLGFEMFDEYKDALDRLFEQNPDDETLLDMESREYKDAILHIHSIMNVFPINHDIFGKCLMKILKKIYLQSEINEFGKRMYELWKRLPATIEYGEQPFFTLSYADDCLSYGDEKQCRELYEAMLNYYECDTMV